MQLKVRVFIFDANKVSLESVPGSWDYRVPYGFEMLAVPNARWTNFDLLRSYSPAHLLTRAQDRSYINADKRNCPSG